MASLALWLCYCFQALQHELNEFKLDKSQAIHASQEVSKAMQCREETVEGSYSIMKGCYTDPLCGFDSKIKE
jgi:hypothetical protein